MTKERRESTPPRNRSKAEIISIGEVTLIGVTDHSAMRRWGLHARRLKNIFKNTEHLIMEGNEDVVEGNFTEKPADYEELAASFFNKKRSNVHWLESDIDLRTTTTLYGLDQSVFLTGLFFGVTIDLLKAVAQYELTDEQVQENIKHGSLFAKKTMLKRSSITEEEIADCINRTISGIVIEFDKNENDDHLLENLDEGLDVVIEYLSQVRDYEEMGPKVAQLAEDLPGNKTVILGNGHIPAMKAALRGLPIRQPLQWEEHKENLAPELRRQVDLFERVAHGGRIAT